jgi:hypothetical protein
LIIVNGVKHAPQVLESAINQANIPGIATSFVVCFVSRPLGANTEEIQIVYQRQYDALDEVARMKTLLSIIQVVTSCTGARPNVLPLLPGRLQRSTLDKLSRAQVHASLFNGDYEDEVDI